MHNILFGSIVNENINPLIRNLKLNYPNSEIDLMVNKGIEVLIRHNPNINWGSWNKALEKTTYQRKGGLQQHGKHRC